MIGVAALALVASGCSYVARVTVASDGTQANAASGFAGEPRISGDGRYSLFSSGASNLVANDTNGRVDVFRHDNVTGTTVRVSVDAGGGQLASDSSSVGISEDGNLVAFATAAPVSPADRDTGFDVAVRNVTTGAVELATLRPDGSQLPRPHFLGADPVLSANGRYLAFYDEDPSGAVATEQILVRDLVAHTTTALGTPGLKHGLTISGDGKHVADARQCDPTCTSPQVLELFDWQGVSYPYAPTNATVSDQSTNGRYVLWSPSAGMSRFDRMTGASIAVTRCCDSFGSMSGDGRVVVFPSIRTDLPGGADGGPGYYAVDVLDGAIRRTNVNAAGVAAEPGDANLPPADLDTAGRYVAFSSKAGNLVPDDTDGFSDGFVADAARPQPSSLAPAALPRGAQHAVVVLAGGFLLDGASYDLGPGVTVESVTHRSDGGQRVVVSVAAAAPTGAHDVVVTLAGAMGAATGTCAACLTVT
jgi:hypothetical protein